MKRIVYICYMNLGITGSVGIREKVMNHIRTFKKYGYETNYIYIENDKLVSNFSLNYVDVEKAKNNIILVNEILCGIDFDHDDVIYIRYQHFNESVLQALKYLHKKGAKVLLEVPTYPFVGEYKSYTATALKKHNYKAAIKSYVNVLRYYYYSPKMKKYIDRVITYSDDSSIWGIETIRCSNGIDTSSIAYSTEQRMNVVNFICVSSCAYWHGYDRFIKGINDYYNGQHSVTVYLHVVGEGPALSEYKQLVSQNSLDNYVKFYGNLRGKELDRVYNQADIALDAMGRHRVGVHYNSSLKGKEYAARGLPIVSGVKTEFDNYENYPYYYRVPADDSNIKIDEILKFYFIISSRPGYRKVIRKYAETKFDFEETMKPLKEYIESIDMKRSL